MRTTARLRPFHLAFLLALVAVWTTADLPSYRGMAWAQQPRAEQAAPDDDPDSPFRNEEEDEDAQDDDRAQGDDRAQRGERPQFGRGNRQFGRRSNRSRAPGPYERNNSAVLSAFDVALAAPAHSTVAVHCGIRRVALGTIVDGSGYILTKASELNGPCECRLYDGRRLPATIVGIDPASDLAMLRVEADELEAAPFREGDTPPVGSLLVTPGVNQQPRGMGIVSVTPRAIEGPRGLLGILLEQDDRGPRIEEVMPDSGAASAGLLQGDVITSINDTPVSTREALIETVRRFRPGDRVRLLVKRGDDVLDITATLSSSDTLAGDSRQSFQNNQGGPLSERRSGFPSVIQHDTALSPNDCGGPIVDLDGKVVGINIARVGRVDSFALPAHAVLSVMDDLKSGKLSPRDELQRRHDALIVELDGLSNRETALAQRLTELQQTANDNSAPRGENADRETRRTQQELDGVRSQIRQATAEKEWLASELE
jgi:serine protease Do